MKFLNRLIGGNVLLKVTSLNSLSVIAQMVCGLIISKVIAVFVGPQGMTLIGNLRNFLGAAQQVSILGMYNGIVKYTAEFKEDNLELKKLFSTSFYFGGFSTILSALIIYFNAGVINAYLFEGEDYASVIKAISFALPFYSLNFFCIAIINGFSKYKNYVLITFASTLLGMLITVTLIWQQQLTGALYAIVVVPALNFLVTLVLILNQKNFASFLTLNSISNSYIKRLGSFAIMKLVSAISLPLIMIAIRTEIVTVQSATEAGYWEAMNRISNYYLVFFTTLLTLYILPKLSEINDPKAFRKEIFGFYKTILPLFAAGMLIIYVLKTYIIQIVLTDEFLPMSSLFFWQLSGDLVKIASIVIAYQFLAKNMFWHYIFVEVGSVLTIYFSSLYFINTYGFVGASMAHLFSYTIHFIVVLIIFRKALFNLKF